MVGSKENPALGAGVDVTMSPYTSCGKCASCLRHRPNACQFNETLGVQRDGALTEYIAMPADKLYTAALSIKELCLVHAGQHTGARAVDRGEDDQRDLAGVSCGRHHVLRGPSAPQRETSAPVHGGDRERRRGHDHPGERMVDAEHGADHAGHRAQGLPRRPAGPQPARLDARRPPCAAQAAQQRQGGAALGIRAGEGAAVHGGSTLVFARAMDATDLCFAGAAEQARLVAAGEVSARELVEASLERIWQRGPAASTPSAWCSPTAR